MSFSLHLADCSPSKTNPDHEMLETLRMRENGIQGVQETAIQDTMNTTVGALHRLGIKGGITVIEIVRVTGRLATTVEAEVEARGERGHRTTEDRQVER